MHRNPCTSEHGGNTAVGDAREVSALVQIGTRGGGHVERLYESHISKLVLYLSTSTLRLFKYHKVFSHKAEKPTSRLSRLLTCFQQFRAGGLPSASVRMVRELTANVCALLVVKNQRRREREKYRHDSLEFRGGTGPIANGL